MGPESGRPALESVGQKEAPQKTKKRKTAKRRKKPATAKKGSGADAAASGDSAASRGRETSGAPARSDDSRGTGGTKEAVQELAVKVPAKKTRRGKRGGKKHKRTQKERSAPQQEQPSGTTVKEKPPADKPSEAPSPAKEQQVKVDSPAGETKSTTEKRPARRRTRRKGQRSAATAKAPEREAEEGERVVPTAKVSVEKTSRGQAPAERPAAEKASDREAEDGGPDEARDDHAAARSKLVLKKRPRRRARGSKAHKSAAEEDESKPAAQERAGRDAEQSEKDRAARGSRAKKAKPQAKRGASQPAPGKPAKAPVVEVVNGDASKPPIVTAGRQMIINVTAGAECRIAILNEGRLEELFIERQSAESHVGNIYKGIMTNIEPSIQAAFVDFGQHKNGFLHISDVQPKYFRNGSQESEPVGKKVPRRERPPIQKCFRRGNEVIVQVAKEGVGTKGPTLTTYLSIPGQFVVMMPGMNRLGVSRKIEDEADRRRMRDILGQLTLPDDAGFILRTAGLDRSKRELQSDVNYLSRLWKRVQERIDSTPAPCELYQESDLVIRTIRDVYNSSFSTIVVDDPGASKKAREFLRIAMPRSHGAVVAYKRSEPIFHYYGIEQEIERLHSRQVPLPSGGSVVIDTTEAMVAIDVNSGKFRELSDAEETAYQTNLEAAEEIARQLRLRDLGGLVVCDFIDMYQEKHKRAIERALRDALRKHKERARILRMSKFGLIEMTRQRQRPSIKRSIFVDCPHCQGSGLIKTPESVSLEVMRVLQLLARRPEVNKITMRVAPAVASLALNERRGILHNLERSTGKTIALRPDPSYASDQVSYECEDERGMPLRLEV